MSNLTLDPIMGKCDAYFMRLGKAIVASGEVVSQDPDAYYFESSNSDDLLDLISIIPTAEKIIKSGRIIIKISKKNSKILRPRKFWPKFYFDMKRNNRLSKTAIKRMQHYGRLGTYPPSSEIYGKATQKIYSIQVTYSEALDAEKKEGKGLIPLVEACRKNKNLEANLCIAEPQFLLKNISNYEIESLYNANSDDLISDLLKTNCYKADRLEKFLFPSELDYLRKLNDSYAALSILNEYNKTLDNRIIFKTYNRKPTLRATFAEDGDKRILDFVYFPEETIGMAGTLNRCKIADKDDELNNVFIEAVKERERLHIVDASGDFFEKMQQLLIESYNESKILPKLSYKSFKGKEIRDILRINYKIDKDIKENCENNCDYHKIRDEFRIRINHCAGAITDFIPWKNF
jgi:hypothetical protein